MSGNGWILKYTKRIQVLNRSHSEFVFAASNLLRSFGDVNMTANAEFFRCRREKLQGLLACDIRRVRAQHCFDSAFSGIAIVSSKLDDFFHGNIAHLWLVDGSKHAPGELSLQPGCFH